MITALKTWRKGLARIDNFGFFLLVAISVVNTFVSGLAVVNLFIAVMVVACSLTLFYVLETKNGKKVLWTIMLLIVLVGLHEVFASNIFTLSSLEQNTIVYRQGYYWNVFGKLYGNRFGIFFTNIFLPPWVKYFQSAFGHLDFALLFNLRNFWFLIQLPFFLIGNFLVIQKADKNIFYVFLFTFFASGFFCSRSHIG